MFLRILLFVYRTHARTTVAAMALLIVGLAGCSDLALKGHPAPADGAPYKGVFTGEYVDGKPLYRLPAIEIVGSRSSVGPGT